MPIVILGTGDAANRCCGCGADPCDGAQDALPVFRTVEASLSKCGHTEWPGYESTPPKYYLTNTLSGTQTAEQTTTDCVTCNTKIIYAWSGGTSFTAPSCSYVSETGQVQVDQYDNDCDNLTTSATAPAGDVFEGVPGFTDSYSSTVHTSTGDGCLTNNQYIGTATNTLSDEYSTLMLEGFVDAALPAFSGDFNAGTSTALFDLSSDEVTCTKRGVQYKLQWAQSLTAIRASCYKIEWAEVFTPESGSVVTTSRSYLWNGSDTETPVYTINPPATQGSVAVTAITTSCSCS